MTVLLGLALLIALGAIGRDGRILPFHGTCAAACVSVIGHGAPAMATLILLPVLNGAGWIVLRAMLPGDRAISASGAPPNRLQACAVRRYRAPATHSARRHTGSASADLYRYRSFGTLRRRLASALLQLVGLLCALNGLLLLGGYSGSWPLLLGAALVWVGLLALGGWLMPRLAWLRLEGPRNG